MPTKVSSSACKRSEAAGVGVIGMTVSDALKE